MLAIWKNMSRKKKKKYLGAVHKLRLQEEGVGGQNNWLFVNIYTIENVNGGG